MALKTEFDDALKGVYHEPIDPQADERTIDYKEVGSLAIGSLIAAFFAILGFFWKPFILLSVVGLFIGYLAMKKILKAPDEITGFGMATSGMILSVVIGLSASIYQVWNYYHNAPPGYEVLDFGTMAFDAKGKVKDEIVALDGKKVFVAGYMYPTNRQAGIEDFTLVRTLGHCKFCTPGTNPADMIFVDLENGMSVSYKANKLVYVGGILSVNKDFKTGELPYSIDANIFR